MIDFFSVSDSVSMMLVNLVSSVNLLSFIIIVMLLDHRPREWLLVLVVTNYNTNNRFIYTINWLKHCASLRD